jgi:phage shock protein PspC (stress-responsive transcriptional regulator)
VNISEEIKRLHELHQSGALTDEEFAQAKAKLLASHDDNQSSFNASGDLVTQMNRFRRSKLDRWLGGVCGGLAKSTGLESWIWRLIFVLFTFCFGGGLLLYLLAWILVPIEE